MRLLILTGAVILIAVPACGSEEPDDASDSVAPPPATVTVTTKPDQEPRDTKEQKPKPKSAPDHSEAVGVDTFEMPDETGNDLQFAQDHLQSITDNFLFYSGSEDATGAGRLQILDSGWIVCSQSPNAGEIFDYDTDIVFYVVKEDETCP